MAPLQAPPGLAGSVGGDPAGARVAVAGFAGGKGEGGLGGQRHRHAAGLPQGEVGRRGGRCGGGQAGQGDHEGRQAAGGARVSRHGAILNNGYEGALVAARATVLPGCSYETWRCAGAVLSQTFSLQCVLSDVPGRCPGLTNHALSGRQTGGPQAGAASDVSVCHVRRPGAGDPAAAAPPAPGESVHGAARGPPGRRPRRPGNDPWRGASETARQTTVSRRDVSYDPGPRRGAVRQGLLRSYHAAARRQGKASAEGQAAATSASGTPFRVRGSRVRVSGGRALARPPATIWHPSRVTT